MRYVWFFVGFVFFKQKTAYEMRISDWSSDVCSSDLLDARRINAMLQHQATNGWRERQRGGSAFVLRWLRRFGGRGRGRGSSGGCRRRSSTGLLLRRRAAT